MIEADLFYVLKRMGYKPDQPIAKALRRVLVDGLPYGPVARQFSVPAHRLSWAVGQARQIEGHFRVIDAEVIGMTPNEVLAYARRREAPPPETAATVTASQLRAAGLTDEQIAAVLGDPK